MRAKSKAVRCLSLVGPLLIASIVRAPAIAGEDDASPPAGAGLEFRLAAERDPEAPTMLLAADESLREPVTKYVDQLAAHGPEPQPGDHYRWLKIPDPVRFLVLKDASELTDFDALAAKYPLILGRRGTTCYVLLHDAADKVMAPAGAGGREWSVKSARATPVPGSWRWAIDIELDERGGKLLHDLTSANLGRRICICVDEMALSCASIRDAVRERAVIQGGFKRERAEKLADRILAAGAADASDDAKAPPADTRPASPGEG